MNNYSGKFVLRVPPALHRRLANLARTRRISLNEQCLQILGGFSEEDPSDRIIKSIKKDVLPYFKKRFGKNLTGLLLFGSYVTKDATASSDIDLLIVLDPSIAITRGLYRDWDKNIRWSGEATLNPHFVSLPSSPKEVSGLWFEIAQNYLVIFQDGKKIDSLIKKLIALIESGMIRKHISNGHPYWVWRSDEK